MNEPRGYGRSRQVKGHSETSTLSSQPSIDEVRQQMHMLLEEAFSLASAGHAGQGRHPEAYAPHLQRCHLSTPWALVPGVCSGPAFPMKPPCPQHPPAQPRDTQTTRSLGVCTDKAQLSLASSCPQRIQNIYINRAQQKTVSPSFPSYRVPLSFFFSCFRFWFSFCPDEHYVLHTRSAFVVFGNRVVVFPADIFASPSLRWMLRVCVCVCVCVCARVRTPLHLFLCFSDLCSLFLMWGCLCCR